jgi:hypothetical protein
VVGGLIFGRRQTVVHGEQERRNVCCSRVPTHRLFGGPRSPAGPKRPPAIPRGRVLLAASDDDGRSGGGRHPYYHDLLSDEQRGPFIERLLATIERYRVDGVDVDLEGGDIDQHYEPFVTELSKALKSRRKILTAAIAVFYKDALSDAALAQYDGAPFRPGPRPPAPTVACR